MLLDDLGEDEMDIDTSLPKRLLRGQFPRWADLPIEPIGSDGCDNAIFRLGGDMAVRLPRVQRATRQVHKEQRWLPILAPSLPLAIPRPLAEGRPAEGFPWHWSIYEWIPGRNATLECLDDPNQAAASLADFVVTMHEIDPAGGPPSGPQNEFRGVSLAMRDPLVREAIGRLHNTIDTTAATAAWEASLQVTDWEGAPVWIHGDLHSGNLLAEDGRLSAVIDFGLLGVGDPACDAMVGWWLFSGKSRSEFRRALGVDEATWLRGRGWALSVGLIGLAYYLDKNPVLVGTGRHAVQEVLTDYEQNTLHRRTRDPS